MDSKNYVTYHLHTELSLLDSATNYKLYVDKAKELGQKAICFTEHGNIYNWVEKKMYCEKTVVRCNACGKEFNKLIDVCSECDSSDVEVIVSPIKYLHGVEIYLTQTHDTKVRDNYHTILIAKNFDGFKEINSLIDLSSQEDHFYYKPRLSFDEFLNISDNVIKTSACLASPINQINKQIKDTEDKIEVSKLEDVLDKLLNHYDYYEIQPHVNSVEQIEFNKMLYGLAQKYNKPLIAATDTHSINQYKAECRSILQTAKKIIFTNEDEFDLTYKSYDELVDMFKQQNSLPEDVYLEAIENTNVMADSVEEFELDLSFKYPKLYENEKDVLWERTEKMYKDKVSTGVIEDNQENKADIEEEYRIFDKLGMTGFMLFMSEMAEWCKANNIPWGACRGSVGGSKIAYVTDITDVNPDVWDTVFSRFCNEDRLEIGDIDIDVKPSDRDKVYQYIIDRFGKDYTAYILTTGTVAEKGTIEELGRAFHYRWMENNKNKKEKDSPYHIDKIAKIKIEYENNPEITKEKYSNLFYYFDGLLGTVISIGIHPAGMVASPVSLPDNYGTFWNGDKRVMSINMEEIHEVSLVKYDILSLKNIGVIKDTCELVGIPYPKAHEIDWDDEKVWEDMITSPAGLFQFESPYAFDCLKKFEPHKINDISMVNAAIRPSGASYRSRLFNKEFNHNPSEIIDDLLRDNNGFLIYQEDTIKFLKDICGLSGSEADNIRRAIGRKQKDRLEASLPQILDGYCSMSSKSKDIAKYEAQEFLQIIEDSSSYQFGKNHSTGYSMIGYMCAMLRCYHPLEFITALLNNADNESDIVSGTELAHLKKIKIQPIKFRYSKGDYTPDKETNSIYKGIASIKFCNASIGEELYAFRDKQYKSFIELLYDIKKISCNNRQLEILIKLDFFSEFGNSNYLLTLNGNFNFFKQGDMKQISKSKVSHEVMQKIIERHSRSTTKTYMDLDTHAILLEIEEYLLTKDINDFTLQEKIATQKEYLGYIDIQTNKPEDRQKLLVLSVAPIKTKDKTKVWAYRIKTISIGTGKNAELTIYSKIFNKNQINEFDTVFIKKEWLQKKEYNGYTNWYLSNYQIVA